jgi:hypothetical protein
VKTVKRWKRKRGKSIPDFLPVGLYFVCSGDLGVEAGLNLKADDDGGGVEVELGSHLPDMFAGLFAQRQMVFVEQGIFLEDR